MSTYAELTELVVIVLFIIITILLRKESQLIFNKLIINVYRCYQHQRQEDPYLNALKKSKKESGDYLLHKRIPQQWISRFLKTATPRPDDTIIHMILTAIGIYISPSRVIR